MHLRFNHDGLYQVVKLTSGAVKVAENSDPPGLMAHDQKKILRFFCHS